MAAGADVVGDVVGADEEVDADGTAVVEEDVEGVADASSHEECFI